MIIIIAIIACVYVFFISFSFHDKKFGKYLYLKGFREEGKFEIFSELNSYISLHSKCSHR